MKKIEIKGITINLGGRETELTIDEAKKLKDVLDELFKDKSDEHHHHHYDQWRNPWITINDWGPGSPITTPTLQWNSTGLTGAALSNFTCSDGTTGEDATAFLSVNI